MITLYIIIGVAVLAILIFVGIYNSLVARKNRVQEAWADIEVQLKRRYDLIPNAVETVKGYAGHEQQVFRQVTEARSRAMQAASPREKEAAEGALTGALKSLFAVAENYPQLRANENFMGLQQSLSQVEEALQGARRYYNAVVRDYNTKLTVFPDRFIAQAGGFQSKGFFQLDSAQEAQAPKVSFS